MRHTDTHFVTQDMIVRAVSIVPVTIIVVTRGDKKRLYAVIQWLKRCCECAVQRYYPRQRTKCAVCGGELSVVSEDKWV